MILLGIDTSGKTASAAVCTENAVLAQTAVYTKLTHSQVILPICKDVLKSPWRKRTFQTLTLLRRRLVPAPTRV